MNTIRQGSKGPLVGVWQRVVGVKADEHFGPLTLAATKQWQQAYSLQVDGVVGPRSWAAAGYLPTPEARVWPSVRAAFVPFTHKCEGTVNHLYLDIKGLVTVAQGCLADPVELALPMPFVWKDDMKTAATDEEIAEEWARVKGHQELRTKLAVNMREHCNLRLTAAGIEQVVDERLGGMIKALGVRFPAFSAWPADAQLATLSYAWARGSGFVAPKLTAALLAQEFETAAAECTIREAGNAGVIRRNIADRAMYTGAAIVMAADSDRGVLRFDVGTVR
jgi:hypothetical protein